MHDSLWLNLILLGLFFLALAFALDRALIISKFGVGRGKPTPPNLASLRRVNDLLPSPKLRTQLRKMMADQAYHIEGLCDAGRYKAAKWIAITTWVMWVWYVTKSPVSSILSAAKRLAG
jgi:hypothetical protein